MRAGFPRICARDDDMRKSSSVTYWPLQVTDRDPEMDDTESAPKCNDYPLSWTIINGYLGI